MTTFVLLTVAMGLLTVGWLTRPLWQRAPAVPLRFDEVVAVPVAPVPVATLGALGALVLAVVGIGYAVVGAPAQIDIAPSSAAAARVEPREAAPAPVDDALVQAESRVNAMVASLADRLHKHPDDAEGWHTLARSYAALGRHAQAIDAFRAAVRLRPDEPTLLAEYAFSAAVRDPYAASGEPARLIARALQLDPRNPKALALAGTLALDRKDYVGAIGHWERLAQIEPADSAITRQLQFSIVQARQLAGQQGGLLNVSTLGVAVPPAQADARVGGVVSLAPALAARVSPQDTVFIFARAAANGPRMPLAVLRRQAKDLPLHFTLDDSLAMAPGATLSNAGRIVVGARVSRSGSAEPRDGDLQAATGAATLGRSDLRLEINEVVRVR